MRATLRRFALGLATLFGRPRGFFIPYRYAGLQPPRPLPAVSAAERLFKRAEPTMRARLAAVEGYGIDLAAIAGPAPEPRFDQDWFPTLDAAMLYTLVREQRPARIVEVGSGHSTRFLVRAARDGGLTRTAIEAIDPAPRADLAGLPVTLHRRTLGEADLPRLASLSAGDMLVIDSSHILMPGSDVDLLLSRLLPELASGVFVHLHDVFLPDDYPAAWWWRGYNEQNAILPMLLAGNWRVEFASHYLLTRAGEAVQRSVVARLPAKPGAHAASLWLRKT
ncbi:MAG: class I SAM-dependent methyltransferase [Alphaproteobacteria bacterium]|nr:class I SAM-dependent methyltransferase [Alphaproteobacteria bacterium]